MKPMSEMTEPELKQTMIACAQAVRGVLGPPSQFVLLVFDDPHLTQYISSCERTSIIQALRMTADRLEARHDVPR